ncbi:MAG TPA: ABC-F family ATP-binding cassette domain-containing protein [Bacteroidales bacterium]|nr:ABC-F family ATP-binding cassette domain-containing protein [Bacteroidales bacterium]
MISYLQVENLTKSYGDLVLFEDISFTVNKDQKIALVARNGAGKTSLLNIISGKDGPDTGKVSFIKDITIGFLEQEPVLDPGNTVIEEIFSSPNEVLSAIRDYELAVKSTDKDLMQKAIDDMDRFKAWDYDVRIKQILTELKINQYDQPVSQLSGGQRKRLALASVLINEPDLLILDEPTNHLDLEMIEWLEEYLSNSACSLLMVTHDRYFLDRICNQIIEIDQGSIYAYRGNYSEYLEKRQERLENEQANVDKAKNLMRKELDWMRRMPQARGTKSKSRIDAFYDLKDQASAGRQEKNMNINVQSARLGKKIIEIKGLSKSFDDKVLIDDFSYTFSRFEKAGIIGDNGSGKTTLLNLISDDLSPDTGTIGVGETIVFGYYRQKGMEFDENQKVIDVVAEIAEVVTLGDGSTLGVSQFLNYFLFPPEVQHTYVYKLSGGEKRRLYLVTVLMQNPNFLILDEPTNDLDIITLNVLEDYLQQFSGCVLIVSHDRFFMDKVVDHLFVFEGEGRIKDFPGNYSQYREKERRLEIERKSDEKPVKTETAKTRQTDKPKKLSFNEKRELELLEKEISELEKEKATLENEMQSGNLPADKLMESSSRIGKIIELLDEKTMRWLELDELKG